jgi:hypothetical protein
MITNFENITHELSDIELEMLPLMVNGFKRYTKQYPIKEPEIVARFNSNNPKTKLNGARLRKLVNHIRCHSMLPLIATSKGYYVSDDIAEIKNQIKSLRERANSINRCADGLLNYLDNKL